VLLGRVEECGRLDSLLSAARLGRSGSLVLRGDPGVGKTALLDYAIQQADGFDVLYVAGIESEAELPYSGLHALLRPAAPLISELPELQARALRVALALEQGEPDTFVAAAATLALLAEAAERRPTFVAIDDAQWLDRASRDAVLFAARRLEAEAIAVLLTTRDDTGFERHALEELELMPLEREAALALLRERWGAELSPAVSQQLVGAAAGNPLVLVEVAQSLTDEERRGTVPLADPLPVSDAVERSVRQRLVRLPEHTRAALLLAAVDETDVEGLAPAEQAGLVRLHRGRVTFVHPLFRAAVYRSASEEQRRAAHRNAADARAGPGDEDLRAWHLAAAALGPDESTAAALEAAADRAERRGGSSARARALERAAELSEDEHERVRRLIGASNAARVAGETRRAIEIIEHILPTMDDPLLHADLVHALAAARGWHGPPLPPELLEAEAAKIVELDPERAAMLLGFVVGQYSEGRLSVPGMLAVADRLEPLVPHLGEWWRGRIIGYIAQAHAYAGNTPKARALFSGILADRLAATTQAPMLILLELYDEAAASLDVSLELGRSHAQPLRIGWTQMCFGQLHKALARYPEAIAASTEAMSVAAEIESYGIMASALLTLADIAAEQGRAEECAELAGRAHQLGVRLDDELTRLWVRVPRAKLALADGRYEEVVELLQPVSDRLAEAKIVEPGIVPYQAELIEAYARSGSFEAARRELDRFNSAAAATERRWALAAVSRCEGLLASDDEFDGWFTQALAIAESPRTQLCYGERLRRARRRREAREQLRQALATFDRLGAATGAARARVELEATGEKIPRRDPTAPERLTPQELQIALQVAEGKTNKEVAAALFLSPKTIAHHLTHVYRKLDIHSRAELIRLLAREGSGTALAAPEPAG
jgi:DNA-binding CsgD family transcriptional regulator